MKHRSFLTDESAHDTFKVFTDEITNSFRITKAGGIKRNTDNLELFPFYIYEKQKIVNLFRHRKNPPLHHILLQGQKVVGEGQRKLKILKIAKTSHYFFMGHFFRIDNKTSIAVARGI